MKNRLTRRTFLASAAASMIPSAVALGQPKGGGFFSLMAGEPQAGAAPKEDWRNAGVIDLSNSPYAKLKTVPIRAVTIEDGFWSQRRKTNVASSIPSMHDELLAHGRMDNF